MIFVPLLRGVLGALLAMAPFAFVFCLPWVDLGIWRQTETATVVLHFLAGLTALLLAGLAGTGSQRARAALLHPVPLLFAAVAAYTAGQAVFSPVNGFDPARTLHGLIKHGVGGLWFLDCALFCAGYLATGRGTWRIAHATAAAAAATVASVLTALSHGGGPNAWAPYSFTGWLGVLGLFVTAALFAIGRRPFKLVGAAVLLICLICGRSATVFVAVASACLIVQALSRDRHGLGADHFRRAVLICSGAVLIAVPSLMLALPEPIEALATQEISDIAMKADGIPSVDPRDHVAIEMKPYGTLWARAWMTRSVLTNLLHHPQYLVFGRGWGAFPDIYNEEYRSVPGRIFKTATDTSSKTFWDPHLEADFHSHDMTLEALASLGVVGAILTALLFLSPLAFARRRDLRPAAFLVLGFCIASTSWFLTNTTAPFLALAFASVSRLDVSLAPARGSFFRRAGPAAATAASGFVLLFFAGVMFGVANFEYQARFFSPLQVLALEPCKPVSGYLAPAREINATLFRRFIDQGEAQPVPFAWFAARTRSAINYSCIMRDLAEHGAETAFLTSSLELRFRLLQASYNFPSIVEALDPDISHWAEDIKHLLAIAPARTDVIIPYVTWRISRGDKDASLSAIAAMSALVPDLTDPVMTWLKARQAELDGDDGEYRRQMATALRHGIANLIPLRRTNTEPFVRSGVVIR